MDESAAEVARQEIASLEQYLHAQRDTQQRFQTEADRQAVQIDELETELAELQDEDTE